MYGSGFTEDSVVRLKGIGLLSTTFVNAQALMAVVPGSVPPGEYTVEVRDPVSGDSAWDRTLLITAGPQPTPGTAADQCADPDAGAGSPAYPAAR
ncbi:MAG: hypothetical protein HND48_16660 [Chloroflexi bacterium]|nr:hypothetical protein [Chloroflexota bacterium]